MTSCKTCYGLFIDIVNNMYRSQFDANQIQKFSYGQTNGTTVAGTGANGTIKFYRPVSVILDTNEYSVLTLWLITSPSTSISNNLSSSFVTT